MVKTSKKLPAMQWYIGDWLKDPALSMCSAATRGIWADMICAMHELDRSGLITGTATQLSRVCRCTVVEAENAIDELQSTKTADVSNRKNSADEVVYTVINRRMKREYDERKTTADRVRNHRRNKDVTFGNSNVTNSEDVRNKSDSGRKKKSNENVTPYSSTSSDLYVSNETINHTHSLQGLQDGACVPFARSDLPKTLSEYRRELETWWCETHGIVSLPPNDGTIAAAEKWLFDNRFSLADVEGFHTFATTDPSESWRKGDVTFGAIVKGIAKWKKAQKPQENAVKPPSLIEQCGECDQRGFKEIKIDGKPLQAKCKHEKLLEKNNVSRTD